MAAVEFSWNESSELEESDHDFVMNHEEIWDELTLEEKRVFLRYYIRDFKKDLLKKATEIFNEART